MPEPLTILPRRPGDPRRSSRHRDRARQPVGAGGRADRAAPSSRARPSPASCWPTWSSTACPATSAAPGPVLETVIDAVSLPDDRGAAGQRTPTGASGPRSRRSATCRRRGCPRSAPSGSCSAPGRAPSTWCPARSVRLLEADLPMVLWWTGDPREHEPLFRDLADECSRLILDLPDPAAPAGALRLGLDPTLCPSSRDSAWFGLARWRELVAQFFDGPQGIESLQAIDSVEIEALSPDPAGAEAGHLAGGMARRPTWLATARPAHDGGRRHR